MAKTEESKKENPAGDAPPEAVTTEPIAEKQAEKEAEKAWGRRAHELFKYGTQNEGVGTPTNTLILLFSHLDFIFSRGVK